MKKKEKKKKKETSSLAKTLVREGQCMLVSSRNTRSCLLRCSQNISHIFFLFSIVCTVTSNTKPDSKLFALIKNLIQFKTLLTRIFRSSHRRCSVKKGVLRNFAKFTGKHPCQSLFLIKLQASGKKFPGRQFLYIHNFTKT